MSELRLCDGCERHIRVSEARCPFCDRLCSGDPPRRSAASVLFAVAAAATVAACYGGPQRNVVPASQPTQEQPSSAAPAPTTAPTPGSQPAPMNSSDGAATNGHGRAIGEAHMLADRTIELSLEAEGSRDSIGAGTFRYPTVHPQYEEILAHVGPMQPGQRRPVRAF